MTRKSIIAVILSLLCVALLAGCSTPPAAEAPAAEAPAAEAPAAEAPAAADFVKAADIVAPAGKTLLDLPADQVADRPLKIATIMVQNNPFGAAVLQGQNFAKQVLADRNCTVDCLSVEDFDAQKWVTVIENCIASGYDAICYMGLSEALVPVTQKGIDQGILMFSFNTPVGEASVELAFFGQDCQIGGEIVGGELEKVMNGEGKYGIITGDFSVISHEQRRTGARSILDQNANMSLVGEWMNNDKAEEAYTLATDMMTANPDLGGIYVTAGGPSGAAKAVEDAGKAGVIMVVCHDVLAESAPYIANGTIQACLDQDPFNQGYHPVVAAFNQLVTGVPPEPYNWYEGVVATPANVKDLFPELF